MAVGRLGTDHSGLLDGLPSSSGHLVCRQQYRAFGPSARLGTRTQRTAGRLRQRFGRAWLAVSPRMRAARAHRALGEGASGAQ
jgi:hypothetical protein